jgi:GGDEF domain-containing protein
MSGGVLLLIVLLGLALAGAGYLTGTSRISTRAVHDPVSGLFTRDAFEAVLRRESARAKRYGGQFSVIKFTSVGPVAETIVYLKHNFRDSDLIARYSSREFVVLLPETDRQGAMVCSRKLSEHCHTQSMAILTGPQEAEQPEEVVMRLHKLRSENKNELQVVFPDSDDD